MTNRIEWKPSQLFGLLVLLLSMLVGCSGGDDGGGAGGSGGMSQGDVGMRPMTDGGVGDVVTPDCTADTDCADNEYCSSGVCNEGCRLTPTACADQDGVGRGCDPMTRTCVELVLCCSAGEGCADVLPADCPGQRCETDEGCAGAQRCSSTGVCVEPAVCTEQTDCLGDRVCEAGVCRSPCEENADCEGAQVCRDGQCLAQCDTETACEDGYECSDSGVCEPQTPCSSSDDCDGGVCQDGYCGPACSADQPCPDGRRCTDEGVCVVVEMCVPEACASGECLDDENCVPACSENAECAGAEVCDDGRCVAPCVVGECDGNLICDVDSGRCIEPLGCLDNPNICPQGFVCGDGGVCVEAPECNSDMECARDGLICDDNECVSGCTAVDGLRPCGPGSICDPMTLRCIDEGCLGDNDCPDAFICTPERVCRPGCVLSGVCPGNRVCDGATGICPELTDSCQAAADCDGDRVCDCVARGDCGADGGRCIDPCLNTAACRAIDPTTQCNMNTGICERDPDACLGAFDDARCGPGRICGPGARCVAGCRVDNDCEEGFVCLDGNLCGLEPECRVDAECDAGFRCADGVCTDTCQQDPDCPDGFICGAERTCAPDLGCVDDADCLGIDGTICLNFNCSPRCGDNADCPGAQVCAVGSGLCVDGCFDDLDCPGGVCSPVTAQCEAPPRCVDDNDGVCALGEVCIEGECVAGCQQDPQVCDPGTVCDVQTNRCVVARCDDGAACAAGEICVDAVCSPGCGMVGGPVCAGNRQCDAQTGLCPEVSEGCLVADDCDPGRVCDCLANGGFCFGDIGRCIDSCGVDNPCERGVCDPNGSGFCVSPVGLCRADQECIDGEICVDGACEPSCVETGVCPGTRVCDEQTGRCPQPERCFVDVDCDAPNTCDLQTNTCVASCDGAGVCPDGLICDPDTAVCRGCAGVADCPNARWSCDEGLCVAPENCFAPEDCPQNEVCDVEAGVCVEGCDGDDSCPGRQVCSEQGLCVESLEGCLQDIDCVRGRVCTEGQCVAPCNGDASCPGLQTCNGDTGRCVEAPDGQCFGAEDCLGARVCLGGTCRDQDCEINDDCAGVCVDFVCQDRVPTACSLDAECGAGQVCSNQGVCVRVAPGCTEDVECPDGTPYCRRGACVPCDIDDECGTAYDCVSARCIYTPPASCLVDNECSFTQRCIVDEEDARLCAPGDCAGNDLDGQRVFARTYTGLELCDGAVNTYTYEIAENEGVEVALRHDTAQGDLALEIVEETDEGRVSLGRVDGVYGAEVLAVLPTARARTVSIVVSGRAGSPTTYMLSIQSLAQGSCGPDVLSGPLGNQSQGRATTVGAGAYPINLCANTQDWYRLPVPPGVTLSVAVDEPQEGLGLALIGPDNLNLEGAPNPENDSFGATTATMAAGDYYVRLTNETGVSTERTLTVTAQASDDAANIVCAAAPELANGTPVTLSDTLHAKRFDLACAPDGVGETQEKIFRFTLAEAADVSVEVSGVFFGGVAIQSACNVGNVDDPCTFVGLGVGSGITNQILEAGDYFVVLQYLPKQNPTLELNYQILP